MVRWDIKERKTAVQKLLNADKKTA